MAEVNTNTIGIGGQKSDEPPFEALALFFEAEFWRYEPPKL